MTFYSREKVCNAESIIYILCLKTINPVEYVNILLDFPLELAKLGYIKRLFLSSYSKSSGFKLFT